VPPVPVGAEVEPDAPPSAAAFCAAAGTEAPPPADRDAAPGLVPRSLYGGSQSIGAGAASGVPHAGTAPSKLAGPAQTATGWSCATHVQVDGQSETVVHGIMFAWHDDVDPVAVVHDGGDGGEDASSVPTVTVPASTRMIGCEPVAGGEEGAPADEPLDPAALPEHVVTVSGTHVNPSPQSLLTWQGTS